jgi:hypothetical protein
MILAATRALIKLIRDIEQNVHLSQGSIVEIAEIPALILTGPMIQEVTKLHRDGERITAKDLEKSNAVREVPPRWYNLRFSVTFTAKSNIDLLGVMEECSRLQQQTPLISAESKDRARKYSWRWNLFPSVSTNMNISEVVEEHGEIIISDVEVYSDIRTTIPLIETVEFDTSEERWIVLGKEE